MFFGIIAIIVFVYTVCEIIKKYSKYRFNLSCHGIYGKFQEKGKPKCEICKERFECYTD